MRTTGEICDVSGIYRSVCCHFMVCRVCGEVFERCRKCSEKTSWELIASPEPPPDYRGSKSTVDS